MAVYRVERTRDYTVMSNYHLKDTTLSLKAKGLLSMFLSFPDDWNYSTRGLAAICKEGVDAIGNTIKELENMVQGKCGTLSYKSRKLVSKPEDSWIRVEGTHEPIISREVWDTVASLDAKRVRKSPAGKTDGSIFSGLLYCADCGFKMRYHSERRRYSDGHTELFKSFICGNYGRSGKTACTIHSIYEDALMQVILRDIQEKAQYAEYDRDRLIAQIVCMKEKEKHSRLASYEQELKVTAARINELEKLMQNLYEDKCTGVVPQTIFQTLMQKYETERAQKAAALPELEKKVRTQLESRQDADRWAEIIRRYTEITELDETILFALVDRIEVGETRRQGAMRVCDVKLVTAEITAQAQAVVLNEAAVVDKLKRNIAHYDEQRFANTQQEIGRLRRRIQELENTTAKLYEDKYAGVVSESTFMVLAQKNEQERLAKAERLDTLLSEVNKVQQETAAIHDWAAIIRKYLDMHELDRTAIDELIDHIEIGERTIVDGQRRQDIRVFYRFVGQVQ